MLCATCILMFQSPSLTGLHHDNVWDVQKAADLGCKICLALIPSLKQRNLLDEPLDEPLDGHLNAPSDSSIARGPSLLFEFSKRGASLSTTSLYFSLDNSPLENDYLQEIRLHIARRAAVPRWWKLFVKEARTDVASTPSRVRKDKFPTRHIPSNTGDEKLMKLMLNWMQSCVDHHFSCEIWDEARETEWFPPRLIDVGESGSECCRLVLTHSDRPASGSRYAALSHCWGKDPSFKTLTIDMISVMQDEIPSELIPKSFQDAIQTCRRLSIKYLWIDSICIIQSGAGAEEDWQSHASQMDTIYTNCILNLAIDHASGPDQGAFVDRNPAFLQSAFVYSSTLAKDLWVTNGVAEDLDTGSLDGYDSGGKSKQMPDTDTKEEPSIADPSCSLVTIFASNYDFYTAFNYSPLQTRGWVLQERLMSPRTLHFGRDRIYWECNEKKVGEYLPQGLPGTGEQFDGHFYPDYNLPANIINVTGGEGFSRREFSSAHWSWLDIVDEYSGKKLTFPSKDKLVAVSAIAKRFARVLGPYCAGLFESSLPVGLLWCDVYTDATAQGTNFLGHRGIKIEFDMSHDLDHCIPSWSWASSEERQTVLNIRRANLWSQTSGSDFNENGSCVLAHVNNVSVDLQNPKNPYGQIRGAELTITGVLLPFSPSDVESWQYSAEAAEFVRDDWFLLPIMDGFLDEQHENTLLETSGLVLVKVGLNAYRRVAIFESRSHEFFPESEYEKTEIKII